MVQCYSKRNQEDAEGKGVVVDEIKRRRDFNLIEAAMKKKSNIEGFVHKLSDKELNELINTTSDLAVLSAAEQEYVNRSCNEDDEENNLY